MRIERWFPPLAIVGLLAFATTASAIDEDDDKPSVTLPKAVKKAVKALYPEAKIRGIAKEKDEEGETVYEVELLVKGKTVDLLIDAEGEIEETEKEIAVSDLPKAVIKAIAKAHPKAKVQKVEEVTDEDDKVTYEVALKKGKKTTEVVIAPNGKILKSGTVEDEADDDKAEAKKGKKEKDDEDGDKAKSKKEMDDDEDEDDDKPKVKSKKEMDDDEDEDGKPKAKKGKKEKDDEDEDDKPKVKSKKEKGEDDEDDDKPKAKKKEMDDEDEDDDKAGKKSKSKDKEEKDEDDEDVE